MFLSNKTLIPVTFALSALAAQSVDKIKVVGATLPPQEQDTLFVTLGVGTQNYTCSQFGNYTAAGAIAQIFDLSEHLGGNTAKLVDITTNALKVWEDFSGSKTEHESPVQTVVGGTIRLASPGHHGHDSKLDDLTSDVASFIGGQGVIAQAMKKFNSQVAESNLGEHYFVPNPTPGESGISPKWDFVQTQQNQKAFVTVKRKASIPAPTGKQDIDWLDTTNIDGELAFEVFRTDTRGGQPPAICQPGSAPITVKYTSVYWFTKPKTH